MPAAARSSTSPATSGASGPTTTRSTPRSRASATRSPSGRHSTPSAAMPALPGRREHLGRPGAAQQRADERVLAPAAADDQDPRRHCQSAAMKSSIGMAVSVS